LSEIEEGAGTHAADNLEEHVTGTGIHICLCGTLKRTDDGDYLEHSQK
jgi:hypothetical protein